MENKTLIIILSLVLLFFIIANHVSLVVASGSGTGTGQQGNCAQTAFGCCPDGENSKIDFYGRNCPRYNPGPGYRQY